MPDRPELPYGSWPSPITIEMAVGSNLSLREPRLDGDDVYWTEGRPSEGGRQVIVRWNERHGATDLTPAPFNARTMAHEYGGGWYAVDNGTVYFVNLADGRVYRQTAGGTPEALTEEGPYRHGDLVVDHARSRLLCVREDMSPVQSADGHAAADGERGPEPQDLLVAIDLTSGHVDLLASGYDFYSTPRPREDGTMLAWLSWRHPHMPWDATELWVADLDEAGMPTNQRQIAGGGEESVVQPEWAPDGSLVFVSDRTGWWNLYRWSGDGDHDGDEGAAEVEPILPMESEFAGPQWVFGMRWFGFAVDGSIVAAANSGGYDRLWHIPAHGGGARPLDIPDEILDSISVSGSRVTYVGGAANAPRGVVLLDVSTGERRVLRHAFDLEIDDKYLSRPEAITFPTTDWDMAHALYYPPTNPDMTAPAGERPPLVVMSHGGPTAQSSRALSFDRQQFTSRGFGVVDVNYRGSNGYGRAYMRKLDGQWGIYDVDDCIAAARYLVERGDVDAKRLAIRGGSAGGYTTLCALVFHPVFSAGASYFGVGDLEALARFTHKYESRYLDRLVAPYPSGRDVYKERSPVYFTDRIRSPLIVLQGEDDMVVPIAQAEQLVASLRERRIPHAYITFPGEGHGFRHAANIRRSVEAELSFYAQVFGFELADDIEPVQIAYLSGANT
ncbi:MAG: S9 family peptidase [Candidatus Limnocylindrales bacterium]